MEMEKSLHRAPRAVACARVCAATCYQAAHRIKELATLVEEIFAQSSDISKRQGEKSVGEGLHFATLATLVGKKHGARWGSRRVTITAVGWQDRSRFVMATLKDGGLCSGSRKISQFQ